MKGFEREKISMERAENRGLSFDIKKRFRNYPNIDERYGNDNVLGLIYENRRKLREIIKREVNKNFRNSYFGKPLGDRQNINIIADAAVFDVLRRGNRKEDIETHKNPVLAGINNPEVLRSILKRISYSKITFQNVLKAIDSELGLNPIPNMDPENILERKELKEKPLVRAALQMYLLKGHFNWVTFDRSEFKYFLYSKSQDKLNEEACINCWDAVLYGLMRAGALEKGDLRRIYTGTNESIEKRLAKLFQFSNSHEISNRNYRESNWREVMSKNPFLVMIENGGNEGLHHDMISFPYSQKQILKMMLTGDFNEKATRPKIFSHWTKWTNSSMGTVRKIDFNEALNLKYDVRITPIQKIAGRSRELDI